VTALSTYNLEGRTLHVARLKGGLSTTHPLRGGELCVLRAWLADRATKPPETKALFVSERRGPLSRKTAWLAIRRSGEVAGLKIATHPYPREPDPVLGFLFPAPPASTYAHDFTRHIFAVRDSRQARRVV